MALQAVKLTSTFEILDEGAESCIIGSRHKIFLLRVPIKQVSFLPLCRGRDRGQICAWGPFRILYAALGA